MDLFWKATAGVLMASLLCLCMGKDVRILLSLAVCAMTAMIALEFLEPVLDLLRRLDAIASLQTGIISILMKIMGISLIAEIAGMICNDCGSTSLANVMRMLGTAAILWLAIPIFQSVLDILQQIVGEL